MPDITTWPKGPMEYFMDEVEKTDEQIAPLGLPVLPVMPGALYGIGAPPTMTLRDWFAGMVLPSLTEECDTWKQAALTSYVIADAMLEARG